MNHTNPDDLEVTDEASATGSGPPEQQPSDEGLRFGRYDIVRFLGKGGFGAVYEGFDVQLQRRVAIKVPLLTSLNQDAIHRYQIEAQNLAKLQHRGIVSVFDIGMENNRFYFVTELLVGLRLTQWLAVNTPSWQQAAEMVAQIADAVAHAHARKVIHRDIKPDNVMMVAQRGPVLVDFGLALSGQNSGDQIGNICGTLRFMAPEQIEGRAHRIDGRTDIYALGVLLYQLLTGFIPFSANSHHELRRQILEDIPQPPRQIHPEIPESIEAICVKAMSKSVSRRYTTAADMAALLFRIVADCDRPIAPADRYYASPEPPLTVEVSGDSSQFVAPAPIAGRRHVSILRITTNMRGVSDDPTDFDPEDQIEAMRIFRASCKHHLEQFGGALLPSGSHEQVVCFGYPLSYEDGPRRAVLAALEIRLMLKEIAKDLAERLRIELQVWISVHSGMVITSGPSSDSLVGDVITLVAKIDRETQPSEVVVTESTYRLIKNHFECQLLDASCGLPGEAPFALHRVERSVPVSVNAPRDAIEYTPLVGRDQEIGMLRDRWELVAEGYGQLVALIGDAGLGKSRLVQELRQYVQSTASSPNPPIVEWACSPYHTNSAFYPAKESLRQLLSFQRDEPETVQRQRLKSHLSDLEFDLKRAMPLFSDLLSLRPDPEFPPLQLSSPRQQELTLEYLHQWLCAQARKRPTLFIVEDLHWIDPSSLDLLCRLANAPMSDPLMCLLTFRPEFTTPWTSRAHQTQLALNRLTRSQVSQIIAHKTSVGQVPPGIIDRIAARTDGVPLFVEEYLKMLVDSSQSLHDTIDQWPDTTTGSHSGAISIPATLQGLLTARLDRIQGDPGVVRLAAALGREFSLDLIAAASELGEAELIKELDKLVESEVLFRRGVSPNCHYLFKHALIQDAAYDAMVRRQRRQVHQQIAEAIEQRFPEMVEQRPELLAHHRTEAGQDLQAAPLWEAAGTTATMRGAFPEAVQHLQKSLKVLQSVPESQQRDEMEYRANVPLGIATLSLKGYAAPELGAIYERSLELCEKRSDPMGRLHAKWALFSWRIVRDEIDICLGIGDEIMQMGRSMQDDGALMEAIFIKAIGHFYHADFDITLQSCQQSWALYERERCLFHTSRTGQHSGVASLCYMALCQWYQGHPRSALMRMQQALDLAETLDHPFTVAFALHHYGILHTAMGRGEEAVRCGERQIELAREQAFGFWETTGTLFHAGGLICLNRDEEALEELNRALARYQATGAGLALPQYLAFVVEAHLKLGNLDAATEHLERAIATSEKSADRFHQPALWCLRARLAAAKGHKAEAEQHARHAIALAERYQAVAWELTALVDLCKCCDRNSQCNEVIPRIAELVKKFEPCEHNIPLILEANQWVQRGVSQR